MKEEEFEEFEGCETVYEEDVTELSEEEEEEVIGGKTTSTASLTVTMKITCNEKTCGVGNEIRRNVDSKINYIINCKNVTSNYDTSEYWSRRNTKNYEKFELRSIEKTTQI